MYTTKKILQNETEFDDHSDYRKFAPKIMAGVPLSEHPDWEEKSRIKNTYGKGSLLMLCYYLGIQVLSFFLITAISYGVKAYYESRGIELTNTIWNAITSHSVINIAINLLLFLIMNTGIFFIGCKVCKIKKSRLFNTRNVNAKTMFFYVFFAFGLQFATGYIAVLISNIMGSFGIENYSPDFSTTTTPALILTLLYTCFIAPITEELLYRGFVLRAFSIVSQRTGIFVSALFFALSHQNISQAVLAFPMGLFFGYIAVKHGSVIPSIIVHFFINTVTTLLYDVLQKGVTADTFNMIYTVYFLTVAVLAIISAFFVFSKKDYPQKSKLQRKRNRLYLANFTFWIFITANIVEIILGIIGVNR
ncbi:hypothetical protein FACS1894132_11650 [Clostridia bacterium]|nr:hypothetical protein FACS1894132_11650 [Clostridia bacterium]